MSDKSDVPRIDVVGAGFGGLSAVNALAHAPADVVVIDERNYHLFQPLLYQVAIAGQSPADIAAPIHGILARQKNARVLLGRVTGIDVADRTVILRDREEPYDYLIVATGARHAYFGHDEWGPVAPGLKNIDDATLLRRKILIAFEHAEDEDDPDERRRLMTFVVVGGGPTGVEMAGAIAELAKVALAFDFRAIDPKMSRIILVEAGPRVLLTFPERLSAVAKNSLERLGVEVCLGAPVTRCDADGVMLGEERIESRTIVWAAGVAASAAAEWLGASQDGLGRVIVTSDLTLPEHPRSSSLATPRRSWTGPASRCRAWRRSPNKRVSMLPASCVRALPRLHRRRRSVIAMPAISRLGRTAAVADFGFVRLTGRLAWLVWGLVHIYFLIGFRNRIAVALDWLWAYVTFQRGARLITDVEMES